MPKIPTAAKKKIPEEAPPDLEWIAEHVTVREAGHRSKYVDAIVCGPLAIHASLQNEDLWTVTHRRIGYRFVDLIEDVDAVKVAEFLMVDPSCSEALKEDTWTQVFGEMPVWVAFWRRDMAESKKWIDPKPYLREEENKVQVKDDPFMRRYLTAKDKHPYDRDGILLLHLGDRYECYGSDAGEAARVWRQPLGKRSLMEMVGFPDRDLEKQKALLEKAGYKVYVADKS